VHAPALRRAERPGLADQRLKGLLANDGEDHFAHDALGTTRRRLDYAEQDAGLAAHLARLLDQLIDDAALGLDGDAVRHLDQQLDQAVHHLGFAWRAPEGQQRQADALGMPAQFPGALDGRAPAEPLGLVRMQAAQQVRSQGQRAQALKLGDLGQKAFQADPAGIGGQAGVGGAVAVVGQQGAEPLTHPGIQTVSHALQRRVVMCSLSRAKDAAKAVDARAGDAAAGEPGAEFLVQRRRGKLARQRVVG